MGKYLLENIHTQFPKARLGIVVANRGAMIRDLLAAYPWIEVIEANRRSFEALLSLWRDFHSGDLVVTQYTGKHGGSFSFMSKLVARMLARHGGLVGFADASRWNGVLYDRLLPVHADQAVAEHERAALRAAGLRVPLPFPTLAFLRDDSIVTKLGLRSGKYVITHFFASGAGRSTSLGKSRELILALSKELPKDITLVVSGSSADRASALALSNGLGAKVVAGDATLQNMFNLIDQSCGVVSVDTGVAHMAAQLGKPLVVLRTCLGPNWWSPGQYGSDAPVTVFSCDTACAGGHIAKTYPACINAIDMQKVSENAVRRFLP